MTREASLEDERPDVRPCYLHGRLEDENPRGGR